MKRLSLSLLALALVGCSSPAPATTAPAAPVAPSVPAVTTPSATPSSPTSTPTPTTASPTPTPTSSLLPLGDAARGEISESTVYEVKELPTRTGGEHGWGALIKTCITKDPGQPVTIYDGPWSLVGPDSENYEPTSIGYNQDISPALNRDTSKTFKVGQCSKGWVIFDVPKGAKVAAVRYQNSAGEVREWRVG